MIAIGALIAFTGCKKNKDGDVILDTYTGNVKVGSTGADPGGDFTGNGDSGTYSFAWKNSNTKANVNFDITTPTGSVQMIVEDKKGKEVLNHTLTSSGPDSYSGVTAEGKSGVWTVTLVFTDFNGDGSYSLSPGS